MGVSVSVLCAYSRVYVLVCVHWFVYECVCVQWFVCAHVPVLACVSLCVGLCAACTCLHVCVCVLPVCVASLGGLVLSMTEMIQGGS